MKQINLTGMGVALVTPFQSDGDIDYTSLSHLIDCQMQNGTDYLVVLGTTAETPTLTAEEQKNIIQFIINKVNKQLPLVLGLGSNNTRAIVEKLLSNNFSGIDAILSSVPHYNKPSQEGIYQHYKHIAKATSLPIVLYNVPGRTGVNMTAETTLRLANEFENIIAIKEASGDVLQIETIIKNKPLDFQVISGDDRLTFPLITLGAAGVISVLGNAFPNEFGKMVRLALAGNNEEALHIHYRFKELYDWLFIDGSPAGVKSILHLLGYIKNELRLPLVPVRPTTYESIREILNQLN